MTHFKLQVFMMTMVMTMTMAMALTMTMVMTMTMAMTIMKLILMLANILTIDALQKCKFYLGEVLMCTDWK